MCISAATTLMEATTISHLNHCNSLGVDLLASILAPCTVYATQ